MAQRLCRMSCIIILLSDHLHLSSFPILPILPLLFPFSSLFHLVRCLSHCFPLLLTLSFSLFPSSPSTTLTLSLSATPSPSTPFFSFHHPDSFPPCHTLSLSPSSPSTTLTLSLSVTPSPSPLPLPPPP